MIYTTVWSAFIFLRIRTSGGLLWQRQLTFGFHINWGQFFVGFEVFTAVIAKSYIFWDVTLYSTVKVSRRFRGTYCLHLQQSSTCCLLLLVSCLTYSSTLKMEAVHCSETSVDFHRTTRRHISGNKTLLEKLLFSRVTVIIMTEIFTAVNWVILCSLLKNLHVQDYAMGPEYELQRL
jgi:hypothetical protein